MPEVRFKQFRADIARSRDLIGLGQSIGAMTHGLVNSGDIYRSSIVQAISALDYYIHGVVLDRSTDILFGRCVAGSATKVGLPLKAVSQIFNTPDQVEAELIARSHIAQRLALETFQNPEDIGTALAMVGVSRIWSTAFVDAHGTKMALGLVVQRRNRIVHQCDGDPLTPGSVMPLSDRDALDSIAVVESIICAINKHC